MLSSRIVSCFPAQKHGLGEEVVHFEGVWSAGALPDHNYSKSPFQESVLVQEGLSHAIRSEAAHSQ